MLQLLKIGGGGPEHRRDRRKAENQSVKRKVVVVARQHGGEALPGVFNSEGAALSWLKSRIAKGTVVNADESGAWNDLASRFELKRINHQEAYSLNGACTNGRKAISAACAVAKLATITI